MNTSLPTHLLSWTVSPITKVLSRLIEMWIIYQYWMVWLHLWVSFQYMSTRAANSPTSLPGRGIFLYDQLQSAITQSQWEAKGKWCTWGKKEITWVREFNYDGQTGLYIYVNAARKRFKNLLDRNGLQLARKLIKWHFSCSICCILLKL